MRRSIHFWAIVSLCSIISTRALVRGRDHLAAKHVVVSFDDGPNNTTTPKLLDTLRANQVRATFFVVGVNVDNADLMRRMLHDGHVLGSHTFGHAHMTRVSVQAMHDEIFKTEDRFQRYVGDRPWFFRAPYGELSADVIAFLEGRHYQIIGWDDDTVDWQKSKPAQVVHAAVSLLKGHETGAIMLMHEYVWTTEAQKTLLPEVYAAGWRFADPLDMLTEVQLAGLKNASCFAGVCARFALTRRWCCGRGERKVGKVGVGNMEKEVAWNLTSMEDALNFQRMAVEQQDAVEEF